jgi:hypothetical protein
MGRPTLGHQYENKPKFEVNKIMLAVMRIINEYRNNRITVDFVSKDGAENDKLADTCDGLYRADEHDSVANEAYDNAFEEAVGGGIGAWRLRTTYEDDEDEDNDRQRIQIEPIFDADSSVFFDLNAKRQDKSDARFCYVVYSMTYESYKEPGTTTRPTGQRSSTSTSSTGARPMWSLSRNTTRSRKSPRPSASSAPLTAPRSVTSPASSPTTRR